MPKKKIKKSFIKLVKEKFKRKTHDKTWDSDEETDTCVERDNTLHNDLDESSITTVWAKSSLSEISENQSLTHTKDHSVLKSNIDIHGRDNCLKEHFGARPKLPRQLSYPTEGLSNVHRYTSRVKTRDFETVAVPKSQNLKRILEYEQNVKVLNNDVSGEDVAFECTTGDNRTGNYESEYNTLPRNRISDDQGNPELATSKNSYSVPNLHTNEPLKAEQKSHKPEVLTIINVSGSKEIIVSPNEGVASFEKTTRITFSEKELKIQQMKDRKIKMMKMFDYTQPKIKTELFENGLTRIDRKTHFPLVIFKGSGSGCGFSAKMLFSHVISKQPDICNHFIKEADELRILDESKNHLILVIDANGGTGDNKTRLDNWFEILEERMPIGSEEHGNLTLILTLNDCSNIKHPILKKYTEYVLDADTYPPSNETKEKLVEALLIQNRIRVRNEPLPPETVEDEKIRFIDKGTVTGIVHFLGSKGCIGKLSEFSKGHLSEGLHFFRKPVLKYIEDMRTLRKKNSKKFLALVAVHALGSTPGASKGARLRQQSLNESFEKPWRSMIAIDKLSKAKSLGTQYEGIDMQFLYRFAKENRHECKLGKTIYMAAHGLVGKFLDKTGEFFKFSNGIIYYSFLFVLYEMYPKGIETCDDDFFFNFIKLNSANYNEEEYSCILIDDRKLNKMTRPICHRFKREILSKDVAKYMRHPVMSPQFFKLFLRYLNETRHLTWKVLSQTDAGPKEAYSSLYHGMTNHHLDIDTSEENITELIFCKTIWKRKRKRAKWKPWTALQEKETLVRASELSNINTFRILVNAGAEISLQALKNAIKNSSEEIIKMIMEKLQNDKPEWILEAAKCATVKLDEANLTGGLITLLRDLITDNHNGSLATVNRFD